MTLEDAMNKYAIPIPSNVNEYDKEEYREFDNVFLKSFYNTFYTKDDINIERNKIKTKVAVVLGGQTGAGKSSLVAETKRDFAKTNRRIALIDDDVYRKMYPYANEILRKCPEFYTPITATASSKVTPKIMQFASDNNYNFIFDGTMKNARIIETMKTWQGYEIQVKIMAASRLRSLASIAIRNAELRRRGEARFISNDAHDETYYGIPETLDLLQTSGLAKEIKIYTRGIDPLYPIQRYSSLEDEHGTKISEKLEELRRKDEMEFLHTADREIEYLKSLARELSENEKVEIDKVITMIQIRRNELNQDIR